MTRSQPSAAQPADQGPSHQLLCSLDRGVYHLNHPKTSEAQDDSHRLLLSKALRLLGMTSHRIDPHPGSFLELLEHNDIYSRTVALPKDLKNSEYQLLILFSASDRTPYLLSRINRVNQVLMAVDGQVVVPRNGLPELHNQAIEIYPLLPATLRGPGDVLRFTYGKDLAAILALGLISLVVVGFSLSIPVLTNTLVSQVLPQTDYTLLIESLVVVSLIIIASISGQYVQGLMALRIETITDLRLQTALWDRLTKLPLLFIQSQSIGDINSRVTAIWRIRIQINSGTVKSLLSALFSLAFFLLMFSYSPALAFWASALVIIVYAIIFQIARSAIAAQDEINPQMAKIANFAYQSLCGIAQIRTLGCEAFVMSRWMALFKQFADANLRANFYAQQIELLTNLLGMAGTLLLFAVVVIQVMTSPADFSNPSSIATFIAFYAAFIAFCAAVSSATSALADVFSNVISLWKRCEPILYQAVESGYQPEAIHHEVQGNFSIYDLSFQFPGSNQKTFSNVSFEVKAGSYVAITGPSGAGKSTLLKLITGLVPPSSGDILVDNIPLRMLAIRAYRRQLGIVIQDARLDTGTILDVVRGGRTEDESAIWKALELACIATEVQRMPLGLHTHLLNGGSNISGGQRQRLALARALLPKPKVLLLDEATSAIDTISQQQISNTIDSLGITRIAIAHRLSTLRNADQVIVIENGTISQRGGFQELLEQEGYLQRMVELETPGRR